MEERDLPHRPFALVCLSFPNSAMHEEIFVYPGDSVFIENSAGKTTVALR